MTMVVYYVFNDMNKILCIQKCIDIMIIIRLRENDKKLLSIRTGITPHYTI